MDLVIMLVLYVMPIASIVTIVRHGPLRNPWWRHENPLGFGLFVGLFTFLAGFVGPMFLMPDSNLGPLIGILYSGPAGVAAGILWGVLRAMKRERAALTHTAEPG